MSPTSTRAVGLLAGALLAAACQDRPAPTGPENVPSPEAAITSSPPSAQQRAAWFRRAAPEVMALPGTVTADDHESTGLLVFGMEHPGVMTGVRSVLRRHGIPATAYRLRVVRPVRFVVDLQEEHRPTLGGIQINFKNFVCSIGFNADAGAERSFITASHCSSRQGSTDGTDYYQPVKTVPPQNAEVIADEVDDPAYFRGGECSRGKKCRYSDASRALYRSGTDSDQGAIARTSGANNGSLEVVGQFSITEQDNSTTGFNGTLHKVGRTTGWTSGEVDGSCVTVNVFGSNIQMLCQTAVSGAAIVGGGDSGAPVFQDLGGNDVRLVGILWGGAGDATFFFSPLAAVIAELGALTATAP